MAQTDFRTALQGSNEIEITVTGRTSGRSISFPIWFAVDGEKLYLIPVKGSDTEWYKNVRKTPTIRVLEGYLAEDLIAEGRYVTGIQARFVASGRLSNIPARAVVLASGGSGHLFAVTTNPTQARGQGLA